MATSTSLNREEAKLAEVLKSRVWRLSNLYWCEDKNGKKVKFRLNVHQRKLLRDLWWLNFVLKVRQIGVSTFAGILQLDRALFTKNQTCGIIDRTAEDAKKKLAKIKFAYDHLDDPQDPVTAGLGRLIKEAVQLKTENKQELEFTNGSKIWSGTSLRGGTVNFLHVSELGYIASKTPEKAKEIAAGSFNTVHPGNVILVETTHEGGRYGLSYELTRVAQKAGATPETIMDWKFHFFGWPEEPSYALPLVGPLRLTKELSEYFGAVEKVYGPLTDEQKHWYIKKSATPKVDMARQYPATAEEALQAIAPGAIYGKQITNLRMAGRIREFQMNGAAPLFTAWDIGMSDYTAIWLLQPVGLDFLALDFLTGHGELPAYYAARLIEWERFYSRPISRHYMPHDSAHKLKLVGNRTWRDMLAEAGLVGMVTVPVTPDVWVGIGHLRSLLPRFYFHSVRCEKDVELPTGRILPSGLGALSGYHTTIEAVGGKINEVPVHDEASHGADGLRTFAEAHQRGMLDVLFGPQASSGARRGPPKAITGVRGA
jgi:hypothetical protein